MTMNNQFDQWIKKCIEANYEDSVRIAVLSEAICHLPDPKRIQYISHLLDNNVSAEVFKSWRLFPSSMSGSKSFISMLTRRMQFLRDVKALLIGSEMLEHRTYIGDRIQQTSEEIEWHQLRDFLEKFS